jgi:hypothetical protein
MKGDQPNATVLVWPQLALTRTNFALILNDQTGRLPG